MRNRILLLGLLIAAARLVAGCVAAAVPGASAPEQSLAAAPTRMTEDAPIYESAALRVHLVKTSASNIYMIETEAGVTLVDAGLPTSAGSVRRRLEQIGRSGDLCQILITHAHIDHVGAAAVLAAESGAPILVHEDDAQALADGRTRLGTIRNWQWTRDALPAVEKLVTVAKATPSATFAGGDTLEGCGLAVEVVHVPGHTNGSSAFLITDPATGERLAFAGDLIITTGDPHVQSSYAEDWGQVAASFAAMQAALPDWIFPGHGATLLTGAELAALKISGPAAQAP